MLVFSQVAYTQATLKEYKEDMGMKETKRLAMAATPAYEILPEIEDQWSEGKHAAKGPQQRHT